MPLSENIGRNEGLAYEHALRALERLLAPACVAGLTVTELNPDHVEAGTNTLERFAERLAGALAGYRREKGEAGRSWGSPSSSMSTNSL